MSLLSLTLVCTLTLAGDVPDAGATSVLRSYDLGALSMRGAATLDVLLAPTLRQLYDGDEWSAERDRQGFEPDGVYELLERALPEQFDYEDRGLWIVDDEQLVVRGPEALQRQVAALLAELERAVNASATLRVDVLTLPTARLEGMRLGSAVDAETAAKLRALPDVRRETHRLELRPGRAAVAELRRERQVLVDYEVEVAQGAFVHEPVVRTVALGTQLLVRGAPTADGLALAYVLDRAESLGEPRRESPRQRGFVSGEGFVEHVQSAQALQALELVKRSVAGEARLGRGEVLVLRSELDLPGVAGSELVLIEQIGGELPARVELGATGLQLVNPERLVPPRVELLEADRPFTGRRLGPSPLSGTYWQEAPTWLLVQLGERERDLAYELLDSAAPGLEWSEVGSWVLVGRGEGAPEEGAGRVEALLAGYRGAEERVELEATLRGSGGATLARCVLPLRVGATCAGAFGREVLTVSDAGAQIAQNSGALDPEPRIAFDGLMLVGSARRGAGGGLVLDLRGEASVRVERERFDLEGPLLESLELSTYDRLAFDERLAFPPAGGSAVLTDAALTLELSLR